MGQLGCCWVLDYGVKLAQLLRAIPRHLDLEQRFGCVQAVDLAPAHQPALGQVAHHGAVFDQLDHERPGHDATQLTGVGQDRAAQLLAVGPC